MGVSIGGPAIVEGAKSLTPGRHQIICQQVRFAFVDLASGKKCFLRLESLPEKVYTKSLDMRIIAGRFKGRRLQSPKGATMRPTANRVREAVFSAIGSRTLDSRVLELFAGTGSFGFEALSRGARWVTFVDSNRLVASTLAETARIFDVSDNVAVLMLSARKAVEQLESRGELFDLIFLDPPYEEEVLADLVGSRALGKLLRDDGLLIVERSARKRAPEFLAGLIKCFERRYGDTVVEMFRSDPSEQESHVR